MKLALFIFLAAFTVSAQTVEELQVKVDDLQRQLDEVTEILSDIQVQATDDWPERKEDEPEGGPIKTFVPPDADVDAWDTSQSLEARSLEWQPQPESSSHSMQLFNFLSGSNIIVLSLDTIGPGANKVLVRNTGGRGPPLR